MSSAFLYVSSAGADHAETYLPFTPETATVMALPDGAKLYVWSTLDELAGGEWSTAHAHGWMAWDGWIDSSPIAAPVSPWLASRLTALGAQGLIAQHAGEFSVIDISSTGDVRAFADFLGARHLYYGEDSGRFVISNRAMLVSATLENGAPVLEPLHLSWFMCSIACLFADQTVWRGVKALGAGEVLRLKDRRFIVDVAPTPVPQSQPWDAHWDQLCDRVKGLTQRGDLPVRVAITGGKDSRVVLAGLIGSGAITNIDTAYLRISEGHPDLIVARSLCAHYGIPFERLDVPDMTSESVEGLLDRHNFQTEHGLHAWDLKGYQIRPREVGLHGNYGEIYRSHAILRFAFGWHEIRRKYLALNYLDLYDVMTPEAVDHVRGGITAWLDQKQTEGVRPLALHDRMHRAARMHRWVGQSSQVDGAGGLSANAIPSPSLLQHYLSLSLGQQRLERVHFELTKRPDDWLWRQPFAQAIWARSVVPISSLRPSPVRTENAPISRQVSLWNAQADTISDLISADGCAEFHDLFDRKKVATLLTKTRKEPTAHHVRAVLGLAGIRRSLEAPDGVHRFEMEPRQ
jgi:hypothetical protein